MKDFILYINTIFIVLIVIAAGCNDNSITQHNNPPPHDQLSEASKHNGEEATANNKTKNRYIVTFKNQQQNVVNAAAARLAVEKTNAVFSDLELSKDSLIHQYKWASQGFAGRFSKEQVKRLRNDPRIKQVVQDYYHQAISGNFPKTTAKESGSSSVSQTVPWGVSRVGGPLDGTGKTAWVLDSGIDLDHLELNVDNGASVSFVAAESANDLLGHGTHVAGTIAAINNTRDITGVAAGATVVSVKVCDQNKRCFVSDVKAGVDYVANNFSQGDVANISLGFPTDDSDNPFIDIALSSMESSITSAANSGLMFAIAAGNDSRTATKESPARLNHSNIWTVSAFRQGDEFVQTFDDQTPNCNAAQDPSYGSNFGNPPIDYSGPGEDITSLAIGGSTFTTCGTSMAAPHIAGLLLAAPYGIKADGTVSNDPDSHADDIAIASDQLQTPFISASIQSDSPRLDWSAVPDAQSYDIYRKYETGSWGLFASTTNTYYVDGSFSSGDLQIVMSPPYLYEDTYSYKVVAVAGGNGSDSNFSNIEYFVTDCTGGPACPQ